MSPSPSPAAAARAQEPELRAHRRFPLAMTISITTGEGDHVVGMLRDLSLGGLFAELGRAIRVRRVVTLQFILGGGQFCMARGTVVRNEAARGFGVEFLTLGEPLRRFLLGLYELAEPARSERLTQVLEPEIIIR